MRKESVILAAVCLCIGATIAIAAAVQDDRPSAARRSAMAPPPPYTMRDVPRVAVRPISVRIALGDELLWSGRLQVGGTTPSRLSIQEPTDIAANCAEAPYYGRSGRQVELTISSQRMAREGEDPMFQLSARFSRPATDDACSRGNRSISIDQSFPWDARSTRRFTGDGGLTVTLAP